MPIYQITDNHLEKIKETTFAEEGIKERSDLQRLLRAQVEIITPNTLVISEEFGEWEDSKRRIDLLGIDKDANLVVIELKRTEDGGHMELQAVRYAAMVSALTFNKVIDIYGRYLESISSDGNPRDQILDFLEWDEADEENFAQEVRIVLASAEFSKELTTAVIWLNDHGLDIKCIRLKPYRQGNQVLLDVQQVIPLPETEEYQVQIREKQQKERQSRKGSRDFTRYEVTVNGDTYTNLPKRGLMYHIIRPIIESGVTPLEIAEIISWRKNNLFFVFDEILDEEGVYDGLMELDAGGKVPKHKRYFSKDDELFHIDGKTYILSNQWGNRTIEAIDKLKEAYPHINISVRPQTEKQA